MLPKASFRTFFGLSSFLASVVLFLFCFFLGGIAANEQVAVIVGYAWDVATFGLDRVWIGLEPGLERNAASMFTNSA